jgi:hypothetical protein
MASLPSRSDFKLFLFSYRHDGALWNVEIPARSWEDARRRVSALSLARCEGEVIVRMPALPEPLARLFRLIRNVCPAR